jgi:phage baseplate assembly protein W
VDTIVIKNRDIILDNRGRIITAGGAYKVAQDLKTFLLNQLGYNRFHPWIGSHLDNFVGRQVDSKTLHNIRIDVTECLNLYTEVQMQDLRKRIDESGNAVIAVDEADPSSLVKSWTQLDVKPEGTAIRIRVSFKTWTGDSDEVSLAISPS